MRLKSRRPVPRCVYCPHRTRMDCALMSVADIEDVPSPCIRTCCLDDDEICIGCGRSLAEIVGWNEAEPHERRRICERARLRTAVRRAKTDWA
jgi:uncharacterized protein